MKIVLALVLCVTLVFCISCTDDYYEYLNGLLSSNNMKCTNDYPFSTSNRCVSDSVDALYESQFLTLHSSCLSLDPSINYHEYTYLSDMPSTHIDEISHIKYRYSGVDTVSSTVDEHITFKSFDIITEDSTAFGNDFNTNTGDTDDLINASWIYSLKYVLDHWIHMYETETGSAFSSTLGYRVNPLYLLNCIATTNEERREGMLIEVMIERVNENGVGDFYDPFNPTQCVSSILPPQKRFIIQMIENQNRGGLIQMMENGFIPIVPISFDLDTLRFVKTMNRLSDVPIISQTDQPSLYGVLNAFDSNGANGAYWEVITNIIPAMSIRLVLKMSESTTNSNLHGIAAFAVGVKLQYSPSYRMCDEQSYDENCRELILSSEYCEELSVTTLDLSSLSLPSNTHGFYIPDGMNCRHITTIVLPSSSDWYCAFATNTISPNLLIQLYTQCMVVEGNSLSFVGGGPANNLNLGYHGTVTSPNTKVKSVHLHSGIYLAFNRLQFHHMYRLEVLVIGDRGNTNPSFNTLQIFRADDSSKLSHLSIAGVNSFNILSSFGVAAGIHDRSITASNHCPYVSSPAPFELVAEMRGKNSFQSLGELYVLYTHCMNHIRFIGNNMANHDSSISIGNTGGTMMKDVRFIGSQTFMHYGIDIFEMRSVKKIRFEGSDFFKRTDGRCTILDMDSLETIEFTGDRVCTASTDSVQFDKASFDVLPKLQSVVVSGDGVMEHVKKLLYQNIGGSLPLGSSSKIEVTGQNSLIGKFGIDSTIDLKNVNAPIILSVDGSPSPAPFSGFRTLTSTSAATMCEQIRPYLTRSDKSVTCA